MVWGRWHSKGVLMTGLHLRGATLSWGGSLPSRVGLLHGIQVASSWNELGLGVAGVRVWPPFSAPPASSLPSSYSCNPMPAPLPTPPLHSSSDSNTGVLSFSRSSMRSPRVVQGPVRGPVWGACVWGLYRGLHWGPRSELPRGAWLYAAAMSYDHGCRCGATG